MSDLLELCNCQECPLNNGNPPVRGEGYITVDEKVVSAPREQDKFDLVCVGMAPAVEEGRQGRPFVGSSGQILRRTFYQKGIKIYYLTNSVLCPLPEDETESKAVMDKAIECCQKRLFAEIESKHPILTIALGDMPLHILCDTTYKIKEVEGRVIPGKLGSVLPITHPAYYWRHPDDFFDFLECMRAGISFLNGTYQQAGEPTHIVCDPDNLGQIKRELDKFDEIAVDTETTGFSAYGWEPDSLMEIGISGNSEHAYIIPGEYAEEFKDILEKKKCILWNAQFDYSFLRQRGIKTNIYFDGMLAHYSIDERPYSHGLKKVAKVYLGCDDWETRLEEFIPKRSKKSVSYAVVPKDVRYEYLAKDVTRTYQLKGVLEPDINKKVFNELLMPACRMFAEIEYKGQRIDPVKMMNLDKILSEELDKLQDNIEDLAGKYINPSSPKQVSEYVYNELGIPVDPHFGFSSSKGALEAYKDSHEIISNILDFRELSKLKGTYIEGFAKYVDKEYRIHPSIKIFGTVTGRLSSEHPSIMNIKSLQALKEIFLPEPGHLLAISDIKGNELRWYCIISGDPELTKILREGGDPHEVVRGKAYGPISEEEVETWLAKEGKGKPREDIVKEILKYQRMKAKAVVFGRIYKRGRTDIERQVGSDVIDQVMDAVDSVAPSIDKYYKNVIRQVRTQGYVESYFGRKRRFSLVTPDTAHEVERQAVNFGPQSAGSDLMLYNMLHLWEMKDKYEWWPFWPYHDSITTDIPDKSLAKVLRKELEEYSYSITGGIMPFIWETEYGLDWSGAKELNGVKV